MAPKSSTTMASEVNEMTKEPPAQEFIPLQIIWRQVLLYTYLHLSAWYGFYLCLSAQVKWQTMFFTLLLAFCSGLGITAGAHRLWSHQSYKAKLPLRIFLALCNTLAFEKDIHHWSRDHRVHHKYSETEADPHNAKRGFFFSHIGWLVCRKNKEVLEKGKSIDFSDLLADPVVLFQIKYYMPLVALFSFALPTSIPMYFWNETFSNAFHVATMMRYTYTLHQSFLVNSAAHKWGQHPYDDSISPTDNHVLATCVLGEGFHNYHHIFPYDYSTSELGMKYNFTTAFINLMAYIGQAYDLKTVPKDVILARKQRTGEGRESKQKEKKLL